MTLGNPDVVDTEKKIAIKKRWWIAGAIILVLGFLLSPTGSQRESAQGTLQSILDENDMGGLKVTSVFLPIVSGLPIYSILREIGFVSRKVEGTFTAVRKDGRELPKKCALEDFEFTMTPASNGQYVLGISGMETFKLKMCISAT